MAQAEIGFFYSLVNTQNMTHALDDFLWHDGLLRGVSMTVDAKGTSITIISGLFYRTEQAKERTAYAVTCEEVSRYTCTLSIKELKDNAFAGNVSNGYLKGKTLWLYLTDGLIEIHAKKFHLSEC